VKKNLKNSMGGKCESNTTLNRFLWAVKRNTKSLLVNNEEKPVNVKITRQYSGVHRVCLRGGSRVINQSSVTGPRLLFSIDKLLNCWQVMHYNEQLPFIEIIA